MQRLTSLTAILMVMGLFTGCGDDDDGQAAVGPSPALTPEQCPAAPAEVTLDELAPVWGGLLVLNASVPSGTAEGFDIELFDPTLGGWARTFGNSWQREDGRYSFAIRPTVNEQNRDSEFKLRIRSRLDGCAPSAWSETPAYTLTDPLSDTSWSASWEGGSIAGEVYLTRVEIATQATLSSTPLEVDGPVVHTVTFAADGVFDEVFEFSVRSSVDQFEGCSFSLHYNGTWEFFFGQNSLSVLISERVPVEDATDGSTCDTPALSTLAINDAMLPPNLAIDGAVPSLFTNYEGLLSTPEGPVFFEGSQLADGIQRAKIFEALSYETATESGTAQGYLSVPHYTYEKQ